MFDFNFVFYGIGFGFYEVFVLIGFFIVFINRFDVIWILVSGWVCVLCSVRFIFCYGIFIVIIFVIW